MTTEFVTQHLIQLAGNTRLGTLSVSQPLSPIGEVVSAFPELYSLSLYGANLLANDLEQIARLTHLRSLNLMATSVSLQGLKFLSRLPDLQRLYLTKSTVTDESVPELARLHNLEFLSVTNTHISREGLNGLRGSLPNCVVGGTARVK